jgi:ubiquinone/menaquinone biosynthesis C-methylase UbiE/uncharacterized protein YbaR (Trm112 family)
MEEKILDIIKCQQCLGKLALKEKKLVCDNCKKFYPVSKGLIFMGYDEDKREEIERIIETESDHNTNLDRIQMHYDFAYPSYKIGLLSVNILKQDVQETNPIAVDIGSGGAPMSKMLSENEFDTYRCDLDPNTLYAGLFWDHRNLSLGKHIVCDASLLPFSNDSIDVIYCKEFVHHIEHYSSLFAEINRVLKKDGIFLMIEPARVVSSFLWKKTGDHFGHYYQTIFSYFNALKKNELLPYRYYLYFYGESKRLKFLNILKKYFYKQIYLESSTSKIDLFLKQHIQRLIGGTNVIFSKKIRKISEPKKRPKIQIVEPSWLRLNEEYLSDSRLRKFNKILKDVYKEIAKWQ